MSSQRDQIQLNKLLVDSEYTVAVEGDRVTALIVVGGYGSQPHKIEFDENDDVLRLIDLFRLAIKESGKSKAEETLLNMEYKTSIKGKSFQDE